MKRLVLAAGAASLMLWALACSTTVECDKMCSTAKDCLNASSSAESNCKDRCDTIGNQSDSNADAINDCRACLRDNSCSATFPNGSSSSTGTCAARCATAQPALDHLHVSPRPGGTGGHGGTGGTGGHGGTGGTGGTAGTGGTGGTGGMP